MVCVLAGEHKAKISELELLLAKLDETVNQLEGKKHSTEACEDMYKARLECLETQLDSSRSAVAKEKEKVKTLTEDLKQVCSTPQRQQHYHL